MDPKATLQRILDLLVDGDHPEVVRDELEEALRDLADWVAKGGAIPELELIPADDCHCYVVGD